MLMQLVPAGPGGVRDFAEVLQACWRRRGLACDIHALDPAQGLPPSLRPAGLARAPVAVLLHYSGYGYQRRGLPLTLLRQLRDLREHWQAGLRLVSYFHESYANGPPWSSAFWLSGLQSRLGLQLARMSDGVCTNAQTHAAWLLQAHERLAGQVHVLPVFSAIGEPATPPALDPVPAREPVAVVFGAALTRARALRATADLGAALRRHGVERLVEVGPGGPAVAPAGLPVAYLGRLEATELHDLLRRVHAGLIDYPASLLAKSSVFAALAAHGVPVLNTRGHDHDADGLQAGRHYVKLQDASEQRAHRAPAPRPPCLATAADWQSVAAQALAWYRPHEAEHQAQRLAALLLGAAAP
ncbi:hypothetical protein EOE66_13045 [Rubrivivax rivuli]|uniref:Glycosyltransferase n=1 Tax=Rubrivivax rivuli TaxID=1862385 RepID=A0A437RE95_9BURK|nr:hypothetical protein EOE66_13045 [Rubrivivax rivuli]